MDINIIHAIIAFGLVIYVAKAKAPFIPVTRIDAFTEREQLPENRLQDIGSHIQSFIARQYASLSTNFAKMFDDMSSNKWDSVDGSTYLTRELVRTVVQTAVQEKLIF